MNNLSIYDELDQAIESIIANPNAPAVLQDSQVSELTEVASDLRQLPRPDFKTRLKTELEWVVSSRPLTSDRQLPAANEADILPSLFGDVHRTYPMRHTNFAASLVLHAAAMVLVLASTFWISRLPAVKHTIVDVMPLTISHDEIVGAIAPHGGGGGGDADRLNAPDGDLPRPAPEQITPPVVTPPQNSRLQVESTIVAPNLHVAQPEHLGDPLSALMTPSNGPGVSSGIGSGSKAGIGAGDGPGTGPGSGG